MSWLFNMLSRFFIAFLPRNKPLLILWLQLPSAVILELKEIKSVTVFIISPSICHEVMGPDAMILVLGMLGFKPAFSLFLFTFIKRLFSSSSLSGINMVLSAYLRLLMFLLVILIPACTLPSPAFLMMYSVYKLNKQGDNKQPWCTDQMGFPGGTCGKEPTCQWRRHERHRFDPWVRKIPWRQAQ